MKEDSNHRNLRNTEINVSSTDLEQVLRAINDLDFAGGVEFREWLAQHEDNRTLYRDCILCREAGLNEDQASVPDVELEWNKFSEKVIEKKRNVRILPWIYSTVAAAVIAFAIFFPAMRMQNRQTILNEEIALQTEDGNVVPVSDIDETKAKSMGVRKEKHGRYNVLVYKSMADDPNVSVQKQILSIPRGKYYELILDDGTEVWVNTNTKITYPSHFAADKRVIELEGEAFFKVAKEKLRPFIVKTPFFTTRVMGTEFNVRAYQKKDASVTLVEGKVAVYTQDTQSDEVILKPGDNASATESGLEVSQVDVKNYTSWVEGYFYFEEGTLSDIMNEMSRWYGVEVVFSQPELKNLRFKFSADRNDSFEEAVSTLNNVGKISIVMQGPRKAIVIVQ